MIRRAALGIIVSLACLLPVRPALAGLSPGTDSDVQLPEPAPAEAFTAAILGDRTVGYDSGLIVLEDAVGELNLLRPELVLHIGDLVPGYIRDMEQWERDIARVKEILGRLEAPFFPVAGNHDVITGTGNPGDRRGEQLYKRHFGPLYYSFDYGAAHFICLYTEETLQSAPRLSGEQLRWLEDDLERTGARHVFVLMHKPLWEYPDAGWEPVHRLLSEYPVRAVFGGHFHHYYKSDERDGIQYYVVGVTGGRTFSPELAGGLEHYCLLRVERDRWSLALVKPGHILPDTYVEGDDFKDMERLRFMEPEEAGPAAPTRSPELGPVRGELAVIALNPLDRPLTVTARGIPTGRWEFTPGAVSRVVGPGRRTTLYLGLRSPQVPAEAVVPPEFEVQYTYVDTKGRTVPISLRRRAPLLREAAVPLTQPQIDLDGQCDEEAWSRAPLLTTARWRTSPYETDEPGPSFRVLPAAAGLYVHAASPDAEVSDFRARRILSDALFVGAAAPSDEGVPAGQPPVVIIFPFGAADSARALRAFWDPREPAGVPAQGVHVAVESPSGAQGWCCEAFVPWETLLGEPQTPSGRLRFNVGAWDNDGDLFSELHSWAPTADPAHWGTLSLQPPEGGRQPGR